MAAAAAVNWDDEDEDQNGESNANPPANRERHYGVDSVSNAFAYIVGNACKFAINQVTFRQILVYFTQPPKG